MKFDIIQITYEQALEMTTGSGTFRKALLDEWKEKGYIKKTRLQTAKENYYNRDDDNYSREGYKLLIKYKNKLENTRIKDAQA